jgi:peptidoglycan/xylan/chitin deacetylase (PgdA/CDA1 family)
MIDNIARGMALKVAATTATIAQKEHDTSLYKNRVGSSINTETPLCTFIFDDGFTEDYTLIAPYFQSLGKKGVCAVCPGRAGNAGYMTLQQIKELQDVYGFEIASHSLYHTNLTTMPLADVDYDLRHSMELFQQNNIDCKSFVYPAGAYNSDIINITRKYHKSAISTVNGYNTMPIDTFVIKRKGFSQTEGNMSFAYMQAIVDGCVSGNNWVVWMVHGTDFQGANGAAHLALFKQVVEYVISLNIPIVTLDEGLNLRGNLIDIGNFESNHYLVSKNGKVKSNYISTMASGKTLTITNDTLITAFETESITTRSFVSADASGFPSGGIGTLVTYRLSTNDAVNYQMWYPYGSYTQFYRRYWTGSAWSAWKVYYPSNKASVTITPTSIGAGSYADYVVSFPGVVNGIAITASPYDGSTLGLIWCAAPHTADNVKIRVYNPTAGALTPTANWYLSYIG